MARSSGSGASSSKGGKLSPVMQQYLEIKSAHEDALLFFRMGDFYEMFFDDAEKAAGLLDITLTSRNRNDPDPIPMCGVPHHSVKPYVAKLLEAGVKVALCEQLELPQKGIARREVTRVITPGTSLDEDMLAPERGNFLASVDREGEVWGLAWTEFSTGQVRVTETSSLEALQDELAVVGPSEIVIPSDADDVFENQLSAMLPGRLLSRARTGEEKTAEPVEAYLREASTAAAASQAALRALIAYVHATQGGHIGHLRSVERYLSDAYLTLDPATRRNLEIVESSDGSRAGSLLAVIDGSVTAMGKRLVRDWLLRPLADSGGIGRRLDAIELLVEDFSLRSDLRDALREIGDLERLGGRVGAGTATPRDLRRLADALVLVAGLRATLERGASCELLDEARADLDELPELSALIARALVDEPPLAPGRGPLIREGYHEEVDRLRAVSSDGKGWMAAFEAAERERTGVSGLKIGYNKVFGYYIEVSRAAQDKVPSDYERKQTLANAERYITEELKTRESEVLGAEERLTSLERHLFEELVEATARELGALARSAAAVALVDVVAGLAETAHRRGHVRPEVSGGAELAIVEGRHPVVEAALGTRFVPNDCVLGPDADLVVVLTGPNMAGKSTYLRQVALIALLAHCGAFVPATSARVPLLDRIFTRIGASDNLARGQSTFMVEMTETANILANMTDRSLVVLDEIGRGTSTFDGISIAWAVAEAMVAAGVKTLFATHYHELAGLALEHDHVANFSVAVRRYKGEIVFLYRVTSGAASGSYGIEVARLAGLPDGVIDNARAMLERFESGPSPLADPGEVQPSLFSAPVRRDAPSPDGPGESAAGRELLARLADIDVETLSPLEALNLLDGLVRTAKKGA